MYKVLVHCLLSWEIKHNGFKIGKPMDVFKKGAIVCLRIKDIAIKLGDYIVGENANGLIVGKILELQINDSPVSNIPITTQNIEVGIMVSCNFKKTHMIFIIPSERKIV